MHYFALHTRCSSVVCASFFFGAVGCGYSTQEYEQQVRESSMLHQKLVVEQQARKVCEGQVAGAKEEAESLRLGLAKRGLDEHDPDASLDEQKQALDEYRVRAKQLDEFRISFRALRRALASIDQEGLQAQVVDNHLTIQLPSRILFDPGAEALSNRGQAVLRQVAEVIRNGSEWATRRFQVAVHLGAGPEKSLRNKDLWTLSALRAKSLVRFLARPLDVGGGGLDAAHLSAAGYVDAEAVSSDSVGGAAAVGERVEIVVQPRKSEMLNLGGLTD